MLLAEVPPAADGEVVAWPNMDDKKRRPVCLVGFREYIFSQDSGKAVAVGPATMQIKQGSAALEMKLCALLTEDAWPSLQAPWPALLLPQSWRLAAWYSE